MFLIKTEIKNIYKYNCNIYYIFQNSPCRYYPNCHNKGGVCLLNVTILAIRPVIKITRAPDCPLLVRG